MLAEFGDPFLDLHCGDLGNRLEPEIRGVPVIGSSFKVPQELGDREFPSPVQIASTSELMASSG